ncbi:DEKNAAC105358 [Brettanomyces naardenensis]|uniref:DEKNAAC105358 n=1 Tax=Brettanomyces naardenensis TaxID=13370 RepID=A0A448YT99_BRENA|nr:DEKNAAC105358 [Brettanomyces naardenensis]
MSYYFAIVGTNDAPIYELEIGTYHQSGDGTPHLPKEIHELEQFIVNGSLDILQDAQFKSSSIFFKNIDSFYGYQVSAYLTQGNGKLLVLTDLKNHDESLRQFLIEINELYVKNLLNPFYKINDPIRSPSFDSRVRTLAKRYL